MNILRTSFNLEKRNFISNLSKASRISSNFSTNDKSAKIDSIRFPEVDKRDDFINNYNDKSKEYNVSKNSNGIFSDDLKKFSHKEDNSDAWNIAKNHNFDKSYNEDKNFNSETFKDDNQENKKAEPVNKKYDNYNESLNFKKEAKAPKNDLFGDSNSFSYIYYEESSISNNLDENYEKSNNSKEDYINKKN